MRSKYGFPFGATQFTVRDVSAEIVKRVRKLGGVLPPLRDQTPIFAVKGDGKLAATNWNVKLYRNKLGQHTLVCNDFRTLEELLDGSRTRQLEQASELEAVEIDDAGGGFPLGGVMVGAYVAGSLLTDVSGVEFYRSSSVRERYLYEHARRGLALLSKLEIRPDKHRVLICPGWINTALRDELRASGFRVDLVRVEGPFQDGLENAFADYVRNEVGYDGYVDPKLLSPKDRSSNYYRAVAWAKRENAAALKTMFQGLCANNWSSTAVR